MTYLDLEYTLSIFIFLTLLSLLLYYTATNKNKTEVVYLKTFFLSVSFLQGRDSKFEVPFPSSR